MSRDFGIKPVNFISVATLSTSLLMLFLTPGYCTFTASIFPSLVITLCTWPIEAAAIGAKEKYSKSSCHVAPQDWFSTSISCALGMGSASSRNRPKIAASSGGKNSPVSMDISCPNFIAAPRMVAS